MKGFDQEFLPNSLQAMRESPPRVTGTCACGVMFDRAPGCASPDLCTRCFHRAEGLHAPPRRVIVNPEPAPAIFPVRRIAGGKSK